MPIDARMPMIAMTTSNSISVKPRASRGRLIAHQSLYFVPSSAVFVGEGVDVVDVLPPPAASSRVVLVGS